MPVFWEFLFRAPIPKVKLTCAYTALQSSGDLIYCYNRGKKIFQGLKHFIFSGTIKCRFENHSCVKNWTTMQDRVYKRAKWARISLNLHDHLQTFTLKIPRANNFDIKA